MCCVSNVCHLSCKDENYSSWYTEHSHALRKHGFVMKCKPWIWALFSCRCIWTAIFSVLWKQSWRLIQSPTVCSCFLPMTAFNASCFCVHTDMKWWLPVIATVKDKLFCVSLGDKVSWTLNSLCSWCSDLAFAFSEKRILTEVISRTPGSTYPCSRSFCWLAGQKMTVMDMIAKQTRIEPQEKPHVMSCSFDAHAANVFQSCAFFPLSNCLCISHSKCFKLVAINIVEWWDKPQQSVGPWVMTHVTGHQMYVLPAAAVVRRSVMCM